ncbi:MAG TPA: hypothetical protein VGO58_10445 [Chitinophagaceae bacterium]|jgi:hypothetical protein|nr:hypothetical protein [Chitinophagaceae bacterium]
MDSFVSEQFNNELPKPDKKKNPDINITTSIPADPSVISVTNRKTKMLPLIIYWKYDYRHSTKLNPQIGVNYFKKAINQQSGKLAPKLNGRQLELNVEEIPGAFAIVDKGHIVLLLVHWHKLYMETDTKDLVVSYRVLQNGVENKSGKITVKNRSHDRGIRFFQSWKSSASEFLGQYSTDMTEMGRSFVNDLIAEL